TEAFKPAAAYLVPPESLYELVGFAADGTAYIAQVVFYKILFAKAATVGCKHGSALRTVQVLQAIIAVGIAAYKIQPCSQAAVCIVAQFLYFGPCGIIAVNNGIAVAEGDFFGFVEPVVQDGADSFVQVLSEIATHIIAVIVAGRLVFKIT